MSNFGRIRLRDPSELLADVVLNSYKNPLQKGIEDVINQKSPSPAMKKALRALTLVEVNNSKVSPREDRRTKAIVKTTKQNKKTSKAAESSSSAKQMRIDAFFKSCPKSYKILKPKYNDNNLPTNTKKYTKKSKQTAQDKKRKTPRICTAKDDDCVIISSSDNETENKFQRRKAKSRPTVSHKNSIIPMVSIPMKNLSTITGDSLKHQATIHTKGDDLSNRARSFQPAISSDSLLVSTVSIPEKPLSKGRKPTVKTKRNCLPKSCPPYKVIDGTNFAVDAFQFGYIAGVTHYFLTHFHADHYVGLNKNFTKPIYMSSITARLVRAFISINDHYINEMELNESLIIDGIEVTALDANHCPGAVMFVFKLPTTGKCILHTGDFRANHHMESEPIFWNNMIHTIYLDTTYLQSGKYAFCTQYESITKAIQLVEDFKVKHYNKRILLICGAYVIGKEKFWSSIARYFDLKVWTDGQRYQALAAIQDDSILDLLIRDRSKAGMHILPMIKITYKNLLEYLESFQMHFDILLAIRPSGWEKNKRPQYRGKINIIGIEYSEHSSYDEMKRFVRFLKPQNVLSTVPVARDLMKTSQVPYDWYKYEKLTNCINYQPTITSYLKPAFPKSTKSLKTIHLQNGNGTDIERCVSSLSDKDYTSVRSFPSKMLEIHLAINTSLYSQETKPHPINTPTDHK